MRCWYMSNDQNVDFSLMLDLVKDTNDRIRRSEEGIKDLKASVLGLREDINGVRGDLLRHEKALASVETDIDRIKARLDLRDA